jgi:phosphatidylethanolamine/phosphatidyl-N-methylethanolamine N-methyltransferase
VNTPMPGHVRNYLTFFSQFRKRFETTGAIAPSSRFLAAAMTRFLAARTPGQPVRVLEIGPGTGPVTNRILQLLQPSDELHLVELNPEFVSLLKQRFESEPEWAKCRHQSTIHQIPLQDFNSSSQFDFIISGLPLNNFPAVLVDELVTAYFRLLKPNGVLSYFEYMYVRPLRKCLTRGAEYQRISQIDHRLAQQCRETRIQRDHVWINIPPAWVQHHRAPAR